jgi:mannitol/fructose-specific phosphotransferase system IIA component (Ntr-type)
LTDLFFLVASRDDQGHLRVLARVSRLIADASFLMRLRAVEDEHEVLSLIREHERQLPE